MTLHKEQYKKIKGVQNTSILVGSNLLEHLHSLIEGLETYDKILVITDTNVHKLHVTPAIKSLKTVQPNISVAVIEAGETHKSFSSLKSLLNACLEAELSRKSLIIGVGGGCVLDISGLVAGLWMRGIDCIYVPTTLLSMVDAAVGGKCAIDFNTSKNTIGLFKQAKQVICDVNTLSTLPDVHFSNGAGEVVKHAFISNSNLYDQLKEKPLLPGSYSTKELADLIAHNITFKNSIVVQDEKETQLRKILNFGHTFGHALEVSSNFELLHGYCVAWGIIEISKLGIELGYSNRATLDEMQAMLEAHHLLPAIPAELALTSGNALKNDKKRIGDFISCVFVEQIGHPVIKDITIETLQSFIRNQYR